MKIVNIINHGFVKFGYNLYKNLETINKHKDLLLYCTDVKTFECVKKLNLLCEVKLYSFSDLLKIEEINLEPNTLYDPCVNHEYFYINFLKYDAFYQTLLKEGSALYVDSDIAVLGDFVNDTKKILCENELVFTFENYPQSSISGKGKMFNGGYFGANLTPLVKKFFSELIKSFNKDFNVDMYFTTPLFRKYEKELKWANPSEKTFLLNHCGFRHTVKMIQSKKTKAYHPTFYNIEQKVKQFKMLDRWYAGDILDNIEKYIKTPRGDEHLKPL